VLKDQNTVFKLYEPSLTRLAIGALLFLTYDAFTGNHSLSFKAIDLLIISVACVTVLFKVWQIEIPNDNTVIFRCICRKITVSPEEIVSFQEWLRFIRVVVKDKSIILWPYIDKQPQLKSILLSLNPKIKFIDESEEVTKSGFRILFLVLGVFIFLVGLAVWLFYNFTHCFK
jgi:hypothetical protein